MTLDWRETSWVLDGRLALPAVLGATRSDWIVRCSLAAPILRRKVVEPWARRRLPRACSALSPVILGHMSEPELADPAQGVWASGEPVVWDLRQGDAWARYGTPGGIGPADVERAAGAILARHGASIAAWLLTEPAWDMLAGAGDPRRQRLDPAQTAANILSWCEAVRRVDPLPDGRPILWAESSHQLDGTQPEGWTRAAVLRVFEGVGDLVQIHGANRYATHFPVGSGYRPWWWADVPGPKGLVECGWLPYAWSERTADPRRLARAGWTLPPPSDRGYPDCADQAERLARWVDLAGEIASDPDSVVTGLYGGTSHGGGAKDHAAPWGLLVHPWARFHSDRWLPVEPVRRAAERIRARWRPT